MRTAVLALSVLLLTAPAALASSVGHDGGEGWWGLTNDRVITKAGFLLIAAYPAFIFLMSLLQFALDKRKERRKAAAKSAQSAFPGGW